MPYISINGCQMYFERLGAEQPGRPPVVLVHGSTQTGQSCWRLTGPLLAESYHVILSDCRGHGRSDNPNHSYSFHEMASDIAGLIHGLGYERAHIIGHSNGGNVALVAALEFPQVVQTAVIQAANAYLSQDLIDKEPGIFDPARVEREAPAWRDEMIALHGQTLGPEYWRELLKMTVAEIISQPNYTPTDLARCELPCLVIQGQEDRVNAPARHAQFIARHIPFAELWTPNQTGHNVHEERLFEWVERILNFWKRRGDSTNEAIYQVKETRYPDPRETIYEVTASSATNRLEPAIILTGTVLSPDQRQATLGCVPPGFQIDDRMTTLLDEQTPWALVSRPVTNMRAGPGSQHECVSQAVLGEPVRVLETSDSWSRVRLGTDGYLGWVVEAALARGGPDQEAAYLSNCNAVVQAELSDAFTRQPDDRASAAPLLRSGKIPFGVRLWVTEWGNDWANVSLPGGGYWVVPATGLVRLADLPALNPTGIQTALEMVRRFIGVPYYWGGRTPFGFDCSGLAQAFYRCLGQQIPRDADQQCRAGTPVDGQAQPGDLLFFGESANAAGELRRIDNITHVAISLGAAEVIHANSAAGGVSINSLDPRSPLFSTWLRDHLTGIRRWASN